MHTIIIFYSKLSNSKIFNAEKISNIKNTSIHFFFPNYPEEVIGKKKKKSFHFLFNVMEFSIVLYADYGDIFEMPSPVTKESELIIMNSQKNLAINLCFVYFQ